MDAIYSYFSSFGAFALLISGFCFLIFVHELGHFLAAKMVDMKVSQFALGIGPAIFSWRKGLGFRMGSTEPDFNKAIINRYIDEQKALGRDVPLKDDQPVPPTPAEIDRITRKLGLGETEYRVNWIVPLGGYVKLLGQEDLNPEAVSNDERSFNRKPAWARAVVLSAGVVMNVIFGLLFFIIAFMAGVEFPPAVVGEALPGGPAATVYASGHENDPNFKGLQPGDRVVQVNGESISDFSELAMRSALAGPGESLTLTVQRDGIEKPLTFVITPEPPNENSRVKVFSLGVQQPRSLTIAGDDKDADSLSPRLIAAGVKPGMTAYEVDGQPVTRFDQLEAALDNAHGHPLAVSFKDAKGASATAQLASLPALSASDNDMPNLLGVIPATSVLAVTENSPAQRGGIKTDDVIARIGDSYWPAPGDVSKAVVASKRTPLVIHVLREGQIVKLPDITADTNNRIGIAPGYSTSTNIISQVLPTSPFAPLNLTPGSRILAVNGQPTESFAAFVRTASALLSADTSAPPAFSVDYRLNLGEGVNSTAAITLTPEQGISLAATMWYLPESGSFSPLLIPIAGDDPIDAAMLGFKKTHQFMTQTYITIVRLAQQRIHPSELRGIVGIAHEGTRVTQQGTTYLLFFLGLLSVNLAVMNFLPIPILDGGQMVLLIIEKLKGSPVSIRVQELATYVGLAIIGSLFLVTLYFDTGRLITG